MHYVIMTSQYWNFSANFLDATTSDLQKLIKENSFELTLEWVLSIIEDEIRKDFEHPVLIDVMPNLKFLSKKDALVKDCNEDMENFEKKVIRNSFYKCHYRHSSFLFDNG